MAERDGIAITAQQIGNRVEALGIGAHCPDNLARAQDFHDPGFHQSLAGLVIGVHVVIEVDDARQRTARRNDRDRHGRNRAIGWVQAFAQLVIKAVGAVGGIGRNADIAGGWIKGDPRRQHRTWNKRDRGIGGRCRLAIDGIACKGIEHIGSASGSVDIGNRIIGGLDGRGNDRDCGRCGCAVSGVELLADLVCEAVNASGRTGIDRNIARGRIKAEASWNCGTRRKADGNRCRGGRSAVTCIPGQHIEHAGRARCPVDTGCTIIRRRDRPRRDRDGRCGSGAIGRIQLFADLIGDGIAARRGISRNIDQTRCRIKRWHLATVHRHGRRDDSQCHRTKICRSGVQQIVHQNIDHTGGTCSAIDGRCGIVGGCNWCSIDGDCRRCGGAVGGIQFFAEGIVEAIAARRRCRIDRDIARGRIEGEASRNSRA